MFAIVWLSLTLAVGADSTASPADSAAAPEPHPWPGSSLHVSPLTFVDRAATPGSLRFTLYASPPGRPSLEVAGGAYEKIEVSRLRTTLRGASAGLTSAAFLGAVSTTYGLWDDRTNWWLAGGAAALGALWGGTRGYENPGFRTEIRWEEE
ncbi:MAG: hypothetical protein KC591_17290 [Gemmatimonadetes bacterium]|nr:hypothetical protein [Gemmatimonadota bacterium]